MQINRCTINDDVARVSLRSTTFDFGNKLTFRSTTCSCRSSVSTIRWPLMAGLPHTLRLIQTVQNAAAPCYDNVTPCLSHSIHWLPAEQRAIFKTAVLVWLALYLHQLQMPVDVSQAVHQWRIHRGQGTPLLSTLLVWLEWTAEFCFQWEFYRSDIFPLNTKYYAQFTCSRNVKRKQNKAAVV